MRTSLIAVSVAALSAFVVVSPRLVAGDPPPLSADDQAKITRLVEDLGSVDFRIREAATKALMGMGEKAKPALEAAAKSDNPAIRFRADQILQGLNGATTEKPVDDATDGKSDGKPDPVKPGERANPWGTRPDQMREAIERMMRQFGSSGGQGGQFEEQMRELERRLREMEEQWKGFGSGSGANPLRPFEWPNGLPNFPAFGPRLRRLRDLRVKVDGGTVWAEASESPRGGKLVLTQKSDASSVATFTGKSVAAILDANPKLREWPGVAQAVAALDEAKAKRAAEEKAAEDEAKKRADGANPLGGMQSTGRSVKIEQTDGHVKVEISETGADGKPVTRTYEGTDLESLKAQHPELKDALGGMSIHFGGGGMRFGPGSGPKFGGKDGAKDGEKEDDGDDDDEMDDEKPQTGPFGLALGPVDDQLRTKLSLELGVGTVVVAVRPGSDAEKLGLRAKDVITKVNDKPVTSIEEMGKAMRDKDASVTVEVVRDGKPVTLKR